MVVFCFNTQREGKEMKKIFILPILIAPIVAHATDPIGPSAVGQGETAVVATAPAPYAIAREEIGDTTNVVSASYVKGAYNDAIAAINNIGYQVGTLDYAVSNFVQQKLSGGSGNDDIQTTLMQADTGLGAAIMTNYNELVNESDLKDTLSSVVGTASFIKGAIDTQRVSAVTTWGDDSHPTNLQLTTASN